MQDRFKFRGFDIKNEEMIYSDNEDNTEESGIFILDEEGIWIKAYYGIDTVIGGDIEQIDDYGKIETIIMQCTGLKDRDGNLIYEGDIVNFININEPHFRGNVVIEYLNYSWYPFNFGTPMPSDMRIIGNIYENPELLNSTLDKKLVFDKKNAVNIETFEELQEMISCYKLHDEKEDD